METIRDHRNPSTLQESTHISHAYSSLCLSRRPLACEQWQLNAIAETTAMATEPGL